MWGLSTEDQGLAGKLACSHEEASASRPLAPHLSLSARLDSSLGCSVSMLQSLSRGCQQVHGFEERL